MTIELSTMLSISLKIGDSDPKNRVFSRTKILLNNKIDIDY
jgi:hypothetical protein